MADESTTNEPKTPGPINKQGLYSYVSQFTKEAIDAIVEILRTTRNESLKLGAAKVIIDKTIADLKSTEVHGGMNPDGTTEPIRLFINAGHGFLPAAISVSTPPAPTPSPIPAEVQGTNLAPQGMEDNNSNNGNGQASTP